MDHWEGQRERMREMVLKAWIWRREKEGERERERERERENEIKDDGMN